MNSVIFSKCLELLKTLQCRDAAEVWKNFAERPEGFADMNFEDVLEVMLTAEKNGQTTSGNVVTSGKNTFKSNTVADHHQ